MEQKPDLCLKYKGQIFAFYDEEVSFDAAKEFCMKRHNSELYSPEEEDIMPLVNAYVYFSASNYNFHLNAYSPLAICEYK